MPSRGSMVGNTGVTSVSAVLRASKSKLTDLNNRNKRRQSDYYLRRMFLRSLVKKAKELQRAQPLALIKGDGTLDNDFPCPRVAAFLPLHSKHHARRRPLQSCSDFECVPAGPSISTSTEDARSSTVGACTCAPMCVKSPKSTTEPVMRAALTPNDQREDLQA
ncbi:hypothetical protein V5799_030363 [Amblyomma americanum]|uniref:Uncharacterized protein n=1 Tax=Amblyomma americanum TaxID=6943 RepID=A0AAQ4ENC7_AMBAM